MDAAHPTPDLDPRAARRIFWGVALAFAALTTLLPPLCFPTFRSDVLEQIVIGREWVQGTAKHPALTTWIMQVFWVCLGGSRFAPSLAASLCATATLWAVWRLGRDYVPEREALVAALCLTAYWYTSLGGAAMYNNNVTLMTCWSLAVLSLHVALKTDRPPAWIGTGLLLGAALLCKYSAVVLVLSMGAFMLGNAAARRRLRTAGPWLAAATMLLVLLPHVAFVLQEFDGSYAYLESKRSSLGFGAFCLLLGRDWLIQLSIAAPLLLVVAPVIGWRPRRARHPTGDGWSAAFLPAMFGLPIIVQTLLQCATRVAFTQRSYGAPLWILAGLCAVFIFETTTDGRRWRRSMGFAATLAAALLVSLPVATATTYRWSARPNARFFPGHDLARSVDTVWERECAGPCPYLAGRPEDEHACWAAGALSRHQPHVIDPALGRWARDEDLNARGGVVLWTWREGDDHGGVPADIARRFPRASLGGSFDLPYLLRSPAAPRVRAGVAVVAPRRDLRVAAEDGPRVR